MNHSAAKASITITIEIDWTTLEVVRSPSDCAVPCTCRPSRQPIRAMIIAKIGAFTMPTTKWRISIISCMRAMYATAGMSRFNAPTAMPPSRPATIAMKVSSGSITSNASTRGITSRSTGSRPSTRIASTSSRLTIMPICAVNALAVRPASRIAVSSTPNSRRKAALTSSTTKMVAPKSRKTIAPTKAITAPTMNDSSATRGAASRPTCSMWWTVAITRKRLGSLNRRSSLTSTSPRKAISAITSR